MNKTSEQEFLDSLPDSENDFLSTIPDATPDQSLAGKIVSSISPENPDTQNGPFLSRLYSGTKEMFLPTVDSVKRLFNPSAGQFGPSRVLEQEGQRVAKVVRSSGQNIVDTLAESKFGQNYPKLAATVGTPISMATDLTSNSLTPTSLQQNLGAEGIGLTGEIVGPALKKSAIPYARRSLGFQKGQMTSKSGFEALRKQALANQTASEMLSKNVISKTGDTTTTTNNAMKIIHDAQDTLNKVIGHMDDAGVTIDYNDLGSKLIDTLKPRVPEQQAIVTNILKDLESFPDPQHIPISEAKKILKDYWGTKGFERSMIGTPAAELYRKASMALENEIRSKVMDSAPKELADAYSLANKSYGSAVHALSGLGNKLAGEMGNNVISLPSTIWAASRAASGDFLGALGAVGASELAKRKGSGIAANLIYGAGKTVEGSVRPGFLQSLYRSSGIGADKTTKINSIGSIPPSEPKKNSDVNVVDDTSLPRFLRESPNGTRFKIKGSDKTYKVVPRKERTEFKNEQDRKNYQLSRKVLGAYRTKTYTLA